MDTYCHHCRREIPRGEPVAYFRRGAQSGRAWTHLVCGKIRYSEKVTDQHACVACGAAVFGERDSDIEWDGARLKAGHPWRTWEIFCSERCLWRWQKRKRRPHRTPIDCAVCGREFTPRRSTRRTCSAACRQRAYRERRRAEGALR